MPLEPTEPGIGGTARAMPMFTFIANRLAAGAAAPIREYADLSVTESRLLWLIGAREANMAAEAVRSIGIDKAAVSRSVNRLIEHGLVLSTPDARHKARNLLTLTDKGVECGMALGRFMAAREELLLAALDPAEREGFLVSLAKILANVEAANTVDLRHEKPPTSE